MTTETPQQIALNFFSLAEQDFEMSFFRRKAIQNSEAPYEFCRQYKIPEDQGAHEDSQYSNYWVSATEREDFEPFTCSSKANPYLSIFLLFEDLLKSCGDSDIQHSVQRKFIQRVVFPIDSHPEGDSCIWVSPYYLKSLKQFGFLVDFWFRLNDGQSMTREVLRLSHSLDSHYRENKNYYIDRYKILQKFVQEIQPIVFPIRSALQFELEIKRTTATPPATLLSPKRYQANGTRVNSSQFVAVNSTGPHTPAPSNARICFVYRPSDKPLSHDLYKALRGDTFSTFSGMKSMFSFELNKQSVFGLPVEDFDYETVMAAANTIAEKSDGGVVVPLVLVPWSKHGAENSDDQYYSAKHAFLTNGLPSQFVSIPLVRNPSALKWSISNVGLATFAKLGGKPWKVVSDADDCLIVGVGQSHRKLEDNAVDRFYAYCVLSDSSGLYEDLRVLADTESEESYLASLTKQLINVFKEHQSQYKRIAIHAPYTLKRKEMQAIDESLRQFEKSSTSQIKFAVLKFNNKSQFLGFSTNNSRVPYESSVIELAWNEFLVWFEGLEVNRPTAKARYSRPMHIRFINPNSDLTDVDMRQFLQDSLNLSGANWRGFNAKSLPVSVFYAQRIANYFKHFQRLGLSEPNLEQLTPWFL